MEQVQSFLTTNCDYHNESPPLSSSATNTSHETHSSSQGCDSSFNSPEPSNASDNDKSCNITKPSISHLCIATIKEVTTQISFLAVNNDTLYAASIGAINVYDLTDLSRIDKFGSGSGLVKSIAFSDNKVFTAHQDCKIRVWHRAMINATSRDKQLHKHQLVHTLPTLKNRLYKCMSAKNYVQVRRHEKKLWIEHADAVSGLAIDIDLGLMYSVSWDKSFKTWKVSSSDSEVHCLESVEAHSDAINTIVLSPCDKTMYTGSADGLINVWRLDGDRKKHVLLTNLVKHESSINALALRQDGLILFSGGGDRIILVWERCDHGEDQCKRYMHDACCLKGHRGAILCLVHVNNKGFLVSGSSDKTVRIWRYEKELGGCCLAIFEEHCKAVKSLVTVSGKDLYDDDDGRFLIVSGSLHGEIRVWRVMIS